MTTHPTPAPGDIWNYHYDAGQLVRDYHVFVIGWDETESSYECLTLETGVISHWLMDVEGDVHVWRKVA